MKRILAVGILVLTVALIVSVPAFAQGHGDSGAPNGTCPPGFDHAHKVHDGAGHDDGGHDDGGHGDHKHVGNDKDQNGDGWVCVKHTGKGDKIHVHADNNYPRG